MSVIALGCSSNGGSGGGGSLPSCPATKTCAQSSAGEACLESCSPDGGGGCPSGTVCSTTSGCCEGTACAAVSVHVCCPPSGC